MNLSAHRLSFHDKLGDNKHADFACSHWEEEERISADEFQNLQMQVCRRRRWLCRQFSHLTRIPPMGLHFLRVSLCVALEIAPTLMEHLFVMLTCSFGSIGILAG